jgi:hypothetical protein
VTGDWRKQHNEELQSSYSSLDIIRMIKLRRMRWAGCVAHMGDQKCVRCKSVNWDKALFDTDSNDT